MFVIHDMDHLNKQLKFKFNITCEIINNEPEIKIEDDNIDDDNISTTSSNNNNKMRNEDNMITCECGLCYHKSYKPRHLKAKYILKD